MTKSQLKNNTNNTRDPKDLIKFTKQHNCLADLKRQHKKADFNHLNPFQDP